MGGELKYFTKDMDLIILIKLPRKVRLEFLLPLVEDVVALVVAEADMAAIAAAEAL